jgi:G protein beta subunit-like protein
MNYTGHTNNVTVAGFQRDSKWMFSSSEDGTIKIWDLRAAGCQRDYNCKSAVNSVVLHPNQGELICVCEDGALRIWDLVANTCSFEHVPDGTVPLRSVSISADASSLAAVGNTGQCFVWNTAASRGQHPVAARTFAAHQALALKCKHSPDGRLLATTSADHTTKLWDVSAGYAPLHTLTGHAGWVWDCAFSADSAYLVTASSDRCAKLWDVKSGEAILDYRSHSKPLTAVALNDS